ncbi:MAG: flippase-like domain-containing protein [candidate division Zixibacteria bacterium]|nr:flippase-like domain-containing protein [candidate division Zixibacteria bacterium]
MKIKKYIPVIVGIALLIISFYDYDFNQLGEILQRINFFILIPVVLFGLANLFVRSQRLRVILNPIKRITGASIFSYYSIGSFANAALPALSGQVVRAYLFSRKYEITKTSFITGAALEVLFDGLCLFGLMVGISFMVKLPAWLIEWKLGVGIAVIGAVVLLVLVIVNHRQIALLSKLFEKKIPRQIARRISKSYNSFIAALTMLRSSRHITMVSFLSLLSWAINGIIIYLMFLAFGFTMGPWAAYVLVVVNSLAVVIVVTPGNVGTFHLACVLGLSLFGVDKTQALSFSVLLYVVTFLPMMLTGFIFTVKEGISLMGIKNRATTGL